jgi:CRP-like cAMP-binding protein
MEMQDRLPSLVFRDTGARLAALLLEIAKRKGHHSTGAELPIKDFMPVQDIAERIAVSRQNVMIGLNAFRKQNVIAFSEKRLLIKDIKRLEKYAEGDERAG